MLEKAKEQACSERTYHVRRSDLPLSCPMDDMTLWNAHPRVYLPIEETGKQICPYCSAIYILEDD
jgi:uncharacterized Zn-finger protein